MGSEMCIRDSPSGQPLITLARQVVTHHQIDIDPLADVQTRPGLPGLFAPLLAIAFGDQGQGPGEVILDAGAPSPAMVLLAVVAGSRSAV